MGFTLPRRFGGLNIPTLVYSIAIEMVSRADASLMNIFGLQGIAETINAFASEELKQQYLPRLAAGELTGAHGIGRQRRDGCCGFWRLWHETNVELE